MLLVCVTSAILLLAAGATPAAGEPYREEAVKAAFLNRFTHFVEWPRTALDATEFRFTVLGAPEVATELNLQVSGKLVHNLPARVRSVNTPAAVRDSHVLFVGAGYTGDLGKLTASLGVRPMLIVVEHPRGLDEGGVINFLVVDNRVRFEVSTVAAQRAGLRVSSQLLSVAIRVRGARTAAVAR